jgi:hypothetical protein
VWAARGTAPQRQAQSFAAALLGLELELLPSEDLLSEDLESLVLEDESEELLELSDEEDDDDAVACSLFSRARLRVP